MKTQCDSGQDALLVEVSTNAGITGFREVDFNPIAVKSCAVPISYPRSGDSPHDSTIRIENADEGSDILRHPDRDPLRTISVVELKHR